MKRGVSASISIALLALFSVSEPAVADVRNPLPIPAGVLDQYKKDLDAFNAAMLLRDQRIREINQIFNAAMNKAAQDARSAMQMTNKPEEKISASSLKKSAVAAAILARESAIIALGQPPLPPVDPIRAQKNALKQSEMKQKDTKEKPRR
jgi:hypothetical protein